MADTVEQNRTFVYVHRVRYRECDPMGVVYHTHYLDWFEAARTEGLRACGLAYKSLEDEGILMMVTDATLKYNRPAFYDEVVEISTTFTDTRGPRIPIDYEVRRQDEPRVLVSGQVVLCCVDAKTMRPISTPQRVQEALARGPSSEP